MAERTRPNRVAEAGVYQAAIDHVELARFAAKLWRLHRFKIFDNPAAEPINYEQMLQKDRVSTIDLSDTDFATRPQYRDRTDAEGNTEAAGPELSGCSCRKGRAESDNGLH